MAHKPAIYTVGHSTHPLEEFIGLLKNHGIDSLVDVRTIPRSRTNPQFNQESLPAPLETAGITYRHIAELGGLRSRRKDKGESPNTFWQNKSFRNYADYAMTENFRKGLQELKALAVDKRCAIMCAEAVWWRCHRRIIADYLMAERYPVFHIMGVDKADRAEMNEAAKPITDNTIVYR
jgi:uncharacterized protein (DUF488 family)